MKKPPKNPALFVVTQSLFVFEQDGNCVGMLEFGQVFMVIGPAHTFGSRKRVLTSLGIREIYLSKERVAISYSELQ